MHHEVVGALVTGDRPVSEEMWQSFWDSLLEGARPERCEKAVALLASLLAQEPDGGSIGAMVDSLDARREIPPEYDAVNVVGTGGGPKTFNMSTASAFVAAAVGVPIAKSGSRAYTSSFGSIDVLDLLGVSLVDSHEASAEALDRFGIAFMGPYVYPRELTVLAKNILPVEMKKLGRFFNTIGPFMAAVPATSQVTGVADREILPLLERLAADHCRRRVWLCSNALGVDELVSFEENLIRRDDGTQLQLAPASLGLGGGSLADLRPAADAVGVVRQFTALLEGDAAPAAIESVCLNAACLVMASGQGSDWAGAVGAAQQAVEHGHARNLLERLRRQRDRQAA